MTPKIEIQRTADGRVEIVLKGASGVERLSYDEALHLWRGLRPALRKASEEVEQAWRDRDRGAAR